MIVLFVRRTALFCLAALALYAAAPSRAGAAPGDISITDAYARIMPGPNMGAVYLHIANSGKDADRLLSAAAPIAKSVELHSTVDEAGVMKMRPVGVIEIAPGATVELKPRGLHIMLMDVRKDLKPGDSFPLELRFEKAGTKTVNVAVQKGGHGH